MDISQFTGKCTCGKEHGMQIKKILLESGALEKLPELVKELGLSGKACIICDNNTYEAAAKRVSELLPEHFLLMIERENIHPNEETVDEINSRLPADTAYIVAVGGGVITDTGKYTGFKHGGIPVIVVPTAASVDGFAANSSIMTFNNFKHPLTTQSAVAIVADTEVLAKAPYRLTASGLGDLLGKYIALADWKFANIATGEELCPRIYGMTVEALDRAMKVIDKVKDGDKDAVGALMYALIMSGLTIQMWGNARPASGAEHMIAHVWELCLLNEDTGFLHGETVGVGTIVCKKLCEALIAKVDGKPQDFVTQYKGFPHELIRKEFGDIVYGELMKYHAVDESTLVSPQTLIDRWDEITAIYEAMPDSAEMERIFHENGMKASLSDLGISDSVLPATILTGSYVRGRMTLYRVYNDFFTCKVM